MIYNECYPDDFTRKNIDYLANIRNINEFKRTVVTNKILSLQLDFFNPKKLLSNSKDVLPQIYESLEKMGGVLRATPLLASEEIDKIERAIRNVSNFIKNEHQLKAHPRKKLTDTIHGIDKHLKLIREAGNLHWVEQTCPELSKTVENCQARLTRSEDRKLHIKDRVTYLPIPFSAGASGSYKVSSDEGTALVVKPSVQEYLNATPGFPKGANVIRERIAYTIQQKLGIDCGVPPTVITTLSHSMFEIEDPIAPLLGEFGIPLTRQKFFELTENSADTEVFYDNLTKLQNQVLQGYLPPEHFYKVSDFLEDNLTEDLPNDIADLNRAFNSLIMQIKSTRMYPQEIKESAAKIIQLIDRCHSQQPEVVSCQLMIENCKPLDALSSEEKNKINPKEYEKFVIDLIMLNTDRHLGNVLVHPTSREELLSRMEINFKIDRHVFEQLLKDEIQTIEVLDKTVEDFDLVEKITKILYYSNNKISINDELEKVINNLVFASINNYDYIYELVLIDHGNALPEIVKEGSLIPMPGGTFQASMDSLDCARHDWSYELPKISSTKFTGIAKEKILSLNILHYVNEIETEVRNHERQFGSSCRVDSKCFDLMRVNLLCLQMGIENDFSIAELNAAFDRKSVNQPAKTIYEVLASLSKDVRYKTMAKGYMRKSIISQLMKNINQKKD